MNYPPPPRHPFPSSPDIPDGEDWGAHRHNVLGRLSRSEDERGEIVKSLLKVETTIAVLQTKLTIYAGLVALVVTAVVEIAMKLLGGAK